MKEWINIYCKFCNVLIEDYKYFPPRCNCNGAKEANEKWLEEYKSQSDYKPHLTQEEFDKKYPITFSAEENIENMKYKLEARLSEEGEENLCLWASFPYEIKNDDETDDEFYDSGLCMDFEAKSIPVVYSLLTKYMEKKNERKS